MGFQYHKKSLVTLLCSMVLLSTGLCIPASHVYAQTDDVANCVEPQTRSFYSHEHTEYFASDVSKPATLFNYPTTFDKEETTKLVSAAFEAHATPDYENKRIYWRIYFNPKGDNWQKPNLWFAFQNNVQVLGDITVKPYWNADSLLSTIPLGDPVTIPADQWNGHNSTDYVQYFTKGRLTYAPGGLKRVFWDCVNLGRYLVKETQYRYNAQSSTQYGLSWDGATNSINNIAVGDLYRMVGAGAQYMGSDGLQVSYVTTVTTTMPEDEVSPVTLFGGIVSFQQQHCYYYNSSLTISSEPMSHAAYSASKDTNYEPDGYMRAHLPVQDVEALELPEAQVGTDNQRELIQWIMYLGYPYDNSGYFSKYLKAATKPIAEQEYFNILHYNSPKIDIDTQYNPVKDYYKGTQQAIWHVISGTDYEPARYSYTENNQKRDVEINGGKNLEELARTMFKQHGPLAKYLESKGINLGGFALSKENIAYTSDTKDAFLDLTAPCKKNSDPIYLDIHVVDQDHKSLEGATFSLYRGAQNAASAKDQTPLKTNIVSHGGIIRLQNLDPDELYTLIQTETPHGLYTASEPIVFNPFAAYTVERVSGPTGKSDTRFGLNYSRFDRMAVRQSGHALKVYRNTKSLDVHSLAEFLAKPDETANIGEANKEHPASHSFDIVNRKLEVDAHLIGAIGIDDEFAPLDITTEEAKTLSLGLEPQQLSDHKLSAKLYYKGLDPLKDYVVVTQIFRQGDEPIAVGKPVVTNLTASDIKTTLEATDAPGFTAQNIEALNTYSQSKSIGVNLGTYDLEPGSYRVRSVILPKAGFNEQTSFDDLVKAAAVTTPENLASLQANVETGYRVHYEFRLANSSRTLPQAVLDLLPAQDVAYYSPGTQLQAPSQPATHTSVKTDGGTYTFQGWDRSSLVLQDKNGVFVGLWSYTQDTPKTTDAWTQTDETPKADSETQTDNVPVMDSGTQTDSVPTEDTGIQTDTSHSEGATQTDSTESQDAGTQTNNSASSLQDQGIQTDPADSQNASTQTDTSDSSDVDTQTDLADSDKQVQERNSTTQKEHADSSQPHSSKNLATTSDPASTNTLLAALALIGTALVLYRFRRLG